jgi:hypothetical protein
MIVVPTKPNGSYMGFIAIAMGLRWAIFFYRWIEVFFWPVR